MRAPRNNGRTCQRAETGNAAEKKTKKEQCHDGTILPASDNTLLTYQNELPADLNSDHGL